MRRAIMFEPEQQPKRVLIFGEVVDEMTSSQAIDAIKKRRALIRGCVGTLYPTILQAEIDELKHRFGL